MCLARPSSRIGQLRVDNWLHGGRKVYQNITPAGDPLAERHHDDGITRFGFHNVFGVDLNSGLEVAHEIDVIDELGIDVQGMAEAKVPWNAKNKNDYNKMMEMVFGQVKTIYSSSEASYDCNYLPGGNLMTVNGETAGRFKDSGTDKWGRFCWFTLRGRRDEGVLVVTAYRVCQDASNNPGPTTAYTQQYAAMRAAGMKKPNPRQQILSDIQDLIDEKRKLGFRPIVMMDANGDPYHEREPDKELLQFIEDAHLADPYREKFDGQISTYLYGSKRLDYILMDPALVDAVKRIGYLGTHEAAFSDHVQAYVDFDTERLFRGRINRPADIQSREFRLEKADKVKAFLEDLIPHFKKQKIRKRVYRLLQMFRKHGNTDRNLADYQALDKEIVQLAIASAKKVARQRYGYMRSGPLVLAGRMLVLFKMILCCRSRHAEFPSAVLRRAEALGVDLTKYETISQAELRTEVATRRKELWELQKESEEVRTTWLTEEAMKRAEALGDKEWQTCLKEMIRVAEDRAINRRLTEVIKGRQSALDRIQIPSHDWFHSVKENELYRYTDGNFEAYPRADEERYYPHHTLKVLGEDATQVLVEQDEEGYYHVTHYIEWFYSFRADRLFHKKVTSKGMEIECFRHRTQGDFVLDREQAIPSDAMAVIAEQDETGTAVIVDQLPIPERIWEDVTSAAQIEAELLKRNKRHLQAREIEGSACNSKAMQNLEKDFGLSEAAFNLLRGTHVFEEEVSPELAAWAEVMKQSPAAATSPPIVGVMTSSEYQFAFKKATEKTSSSSVAGLNYTIWKAMATSDYCASFQSVMISMPFMFGFVNLRWLNEIDVMLEKKKGVRHIHRLRIIGLLEADFNTALKFFFSHQMQNAAEKHGISDEQHGSRKNRQAIDAAIIKLLTFECARAKRTTIGETSYDLKACFDMMNISHSNLHALRHNVDPNVLRCRALVKQGLRRRVKTGLGVSNDSYREEKGKPKVDGEVQGSGDVPPLYVNQSSSFLLAHAKIAPGLHLKSCTTKRSIDHHSGGYVDDTDGHCSADHTSADPINELHDRLQRAAQIWATLADIGGGSIAMHKTVWRMLAWEFDKGDMKIVKETDKQVILRHPKGGETIIDFISPDEPNEGLGFRICPDGNQRHLFKKVKKDLTALCKALATASLTEKMACQALYQRIEPKLSYPLHLSSFDKDQCRTLNSQLSRAILPQIHMNRNAPNALVFGPVEFGGLEFPETYSMQDHLQLEYVVKQLRWDKTVANDILTTLDNIQLLTGFTDPIMEDTRHVIEYVDKGFFIELHNRLQEIGTELWIEKKWTPSLQRVNDYSLMQAFMRIPGITKRQLEKLNAVRLYMRVITISDLTDITGKFIPDNMLNGNFVAGSDLEWPNQGRPPANWFADFRRALRHMFCTNPNYENQCASYGMHLDVPLGDWYNVPRHTWHDAYRLHDEIYMRQDGTTKFDVFFKMGRTGFYAFRETRELVPNEATPIDCRKVGSRFWTRGRDRNMISFEKETLPPGHVIYNDLPSDWIPATFHSVKGASDGSVHYEEQVAAAAWIIATDEEHHMQACFLMHDISHATAYRSELEGIFRFLKHLEYLNITPNEVTQWCDNERAVLKSGEPLYTPGDMIKPDADLVLAIHHLKSKLGFTPVCRHVYGHQNERNRERAAATKQRTQYTADDYSSDSSQSDRSASSAEEEVISMFRGRLEPTAVAAEVDTVTEQTRATPDNKRLSDEAQMNVACDKAASTVTEDALAGHTVQPMPVLDLPYEGSCAMIRVKGKWVTSRAKRELYRARRSKPVRIYCKEKYGWTDETFESIDWETVGKLRRKLTWGRKIQTCKYMHGWLAIGHMRQHITGISQCPGCKCPDETMLHLVQCPHKRAVAARKEAISKLRLHWEKKRVPSNVRDALVRIIKRVCAGKKEYSSLNDCLQVRQAVDAQRKIGMDMMLRGFLAKEWHNALEASGCQKPARKMRHIVQSMWTVLLDAIWKTRNEILHREENKYHAAEDARLNEQIRWYVENRKRYLSRHDEFLANHDVETLHRKSRKVKRKWVQTLDKVRKQFELECSQKAAGQGTLNQWLGLVHASSEAIT